MNGVTKQWKDPDLRQQREMGIWINCAIDAENFGGYEGGPSGWAPWATALPMAYAQQTCSFPWLSHKPSHVIPLVGGGNQDCEPGSGNLGDFENPQNTFDVKLKLLDGFFCIAKQLNFFAAQSAANSADCPRLERDINCIYPATERNPRDCLGAAQAVLWRHAG